MKNNTFFVLVFAFLFSVANASVAFRALDNPRFPIHINDAEPISFLERGIAFYVFPDGQFDFNTEPSRGEMYFRNGRRTNSTTYGAATNFGGGVRIEHDNMGRIRRIGNVFINYDFDNRIRRIGTVYMSYNRFALTQVGGLRIIYNRFGQIVDVIGSVKGRSNNGDYNGNGSFYGNGNFNGNSNFNGNGNFNGNSNFNGNGNFYGTGTLNSNSSQNQDPYYYKKNDEKEFLEENKPEDGNKNRGGRR